MKKQNHTADAWWSIDADVMQFSHHIALISYRTL